MPKPAVAPQSTTITVGDFNVTQGDDNRNNSGTINSGNAGLQVEIATLKNEIKHLNEIIEQQKEQLKDKERTIGILMRTN